MTIMKTKKIKARLYIDEDLKHGQGLSPSAGQAHYLMKVMRAKNGEGVILFNGRDGEWLSLIEDAGKKSCTLRIAEQRRPQALDPDIWLAFSPLKKNNTDFIVEKATELGVSRLIPVFTERTNTARVKSERLSLICMEAAEQCDRLSVPQVSEPITFADLIADWPQDRALLVPDETGGGEPLKTVLESATRYKPHGFLIGPEGGFAPSELDAFDNLPFVTRVGLGPRILRAETAALAALACYQSICGDWESRPRFNDGYTFNARR